MSLSTITVGSNTYTLVSAPPSYPSIADIDLTFGDATASVRSPFTGQTQVYQWPGGDWIKATVTLPPLKPAYARPWVAFLGELRGNANVFQLGPIPTLQSGTGGGTVTVGATASAMSTSIITDGWTSFPSLGDWLQIQYRLYQIVNITLPGGSDATVEVFPSVRETLSTGTAVTYVNPVGLFRLDKNERTINWSPQRLTTLSFQCVEAR